MDSQLPKIKAAGLPLSFDFSDDSEPEYYEKIAPLVTYAFCSFDGTLVLAIGLVVDDAIVVVERVLFLMENEKLSPKQATIKAMEQVSGAIVATTLVLLAIFVPIGFIGGITGKIYQQFAVAISTAVAFSALNALTLSPALCATMLRPLKPFHRKVSEI